MGYEDPLISFLLRSRLLPITKSHEASDGVIDNRSTAYTGDFVAVLGVTKGLD